MNHLVHGYKLIPCVERFILPDPPKIIPLRLNPRRELARVRAIKKEPNRLFISELRRYMHDHHIPTQLKRMGIKAPSVRQVKDMIQKGTLNETATKERAGAA